MQSAKLKTLMVLKLLEEYSDENHALSTTDLMEMLAEKGIECERKSIYADVKALNETGYDIVSSKSPKRGFFMGARKFELPEIRLLIDAVTSAGFITPKKTNSLVDKLKSLASVNQAKELNSQVYCERDSKCDNEEIYYVIDRLDEAINQNRQVKFVYRRRNFDKLTKKSYTSKTFKVSPYALIWKNDHYYLVCNNGKYDNLINLRLDRMRKIENLKDCRRPVNEVSEYHKVFDAADYSSKMFNMFSGKTDSVTLLCSQDLREEIMDRFGNAVPLKAVDSKYFITTFDAAVSDGLVSWIMQYGEGIEVVEPAYLIDMVKEKAFSILRAYQ